MEDNTEIPSPLESEKTVSHAWFFDIDGVITDLEAKRVTEEKIFAELIARLSSGEPVALLTGRSLEWVEERVRDPLEARIEKKEILGNLFVSGEFGGSNLRYEDGRRKRFTYSDIAVPPEVIDAARAIAGDFQETMMWDMSKKTMFSVEMRDGVAIADFLKPQLDLVKKFQEILEREKLQEKYWVHKDHIATNILERKATKALGAKQALNWLKEKGIKPENYLAFGDNESDLAIGSEINSQGGTLQFVFVGDKDQLQGKSFPFPLVFTSSHGEKGTLEYLASNN